MQSCVLAKQLARNASVPCSQRWPGVGYKWAEKFDL